MAIVDIIRASLDEMSEFNLSESDKGYMAGYIAKAIKLEREKLIPAKEMHKLIKNVTEPLNWNYRDNNEEYEYIKKAIGAFDKITKYIKEI